MPEDMENLEEESGQESIEGIMETETTPEQEVLQYLQSMDTSLLEIKESLQGIQTAPPQDAAKIQETLDSILLQVTDKSETVSVDNTEELELMRNTLTVSVLILCVAGVIAGIITGRLMWGKINAG